MRPFGLILSLFLLVWPIEAAAEVQIQFYSKDFGSSFPHAFVRLTGTVDSTGEQIDTNYGFTAVRVGVSLLTGPVRGKIQTVDAAYVQRSDRHFSLRLSEEQYRSVLQVVDKWRQAPQPSYLLNSRNCVYFVADIATALGLSAAPAPRLMKKPRSFLDKLTRDNQALISSWDTGQPSLAKGAPASHM